MQLRMIDRHINTLHALNLDVARRDGNFGRVLVLFREVDKDVTKSVITVANSTNFYGCAKTIVRLLMFSLL